MTNADMIFVLNKYDEVIGTLSNTLPSSTPFWDDLHHEILENGYETFEFKTPIRHPSGVPDMLQDENKIIMRDLDGLFHVFRIKRVTDETVTKQKTIFAETEAIELLNDPVRPMTVSGSPANIMSAILQPSRWKPGTIETAATNELVVDEYSSVLAQLHATAALFNLEIRFRITFSGSRITGRYVDLLQRRGAARGGFFEYSQDIEGLTRTKDTTELATALIGVGKADENEKLTTFASVSWSKAAGNPADKPLGQDWIGDPDALQQFGVEGRHIFRVYTLGDEEDPARLLSQTWDELQRRIKGSVEYEVDLVLLERIAGYEHKKVRTGDTITIKDTSFATPLILDARVLEMKRSKSDPSKDEVVLGEYRERQVTESEMIRRLQAELAKKSAAWEAGGGFDVIESPTAPIDTPDGQYWLDTSREPNIWKRWSQDTARWIPATPSEASQIEYRDGLPVEYYKPNQPGADRTGDNTAKDTSNVGGTPATTVRDEANSGKQAQDKIQQDVGSGTIETTEGAAAKAGPVSATAPANPKTGDKWVDISTAGLEIWKRWNGTAWQEIGRISLDQMTGQIITSQIAFGAVQEAQLADLAVTLSKIGSNAVDTSKIVNDAISAAKIQTNAITDIKINNGAVTATKILDSAVTTAKIAANAVTTAKIGTGQVTATQILDRSIGNLEIALKAIQNEVIADRTLTATKMLANTITANEIAARTITAAQLVTGTITANEIAANAITADKIAANAITAEKIAAGAIVIGSGTTFAAGYDPSTKITTTEAQTIANTAVTETTFTSTHKEFYRFAHMNQNAATVTGTLVIRTNINATNRMYDIEIKGYNYVERNTNIHFKIGFYAYSTSFLQKSFTNYGDFRIESVQLALDENNKVVILVYPERGSWSYPSITVERMGVSYQAAEQDVEKGWNLSIVADLSTINAAWTRLATVPANILETTVGAEDKANAAAKPANDRIQLWTHTGTTYIAGGQIFTDSITANQIAAGAVTASEILGRTITADKLVTGTITANEIGAGQITAGKIASRSIAADRIVSGALTANEIMGSTITGVKIAGTTITGDKIAARTIGADKIVANSITANEIASKTITAAHIASGTITTELIAATGISADVIKGGTISGGTVFAGTLSAATGTFSGTVSVGSLTNTSGYVEVSGNGITSRKRYVVQSNVWYEYGAIITGGGLSLNYQDVGYSMDGTASASIMMDESTLNVEINETVGGVTSPGYMSIIGNLNVTEDANIYGDLTTTGGMFFLGGTYGELNPSGTLLIPAGTQMTVQRVANFQKSVNTDAGITIPASVNTGVYQQYYGYILRNNGAGDTVLNATRNKDVFIGNENTGGIRLVAPITANINMGDFVVYTANRSWMTPYYYNGGPYGSSQYQDFSYYKDVQGFVHFRGMIRPPSYTGAVICYMPFGYRPSNRRVFIVFSSAGAARIDVLADGSVIMVTGPTSGYVSMDGIYFNT